MTGSHDPLIVAISILVAGVASYAAFDFADRGIQARGRVRLGWLLGVALALAIAYWTMDLLGILALRAAVALIIVVALLGLARVATSADRSRRAVEARILESITDAFVGLDREWRFTYVNGAAERVLGKSRGELLGRSAWTGFSEGPESRFAEHCRRALDEGVTVHFEDEDVTGEKRVEFHVYPAEDGLAIYFQDVTERRRAEERALELAVERARRREAEAAREQVAASEERFRLISLATNDALWEYDGREGRLWWSESFSRLFGYAPGGRDDGSWEERVHPEDRPRVLRLLGQALADPQRPTWSDEYRFRRKDGSYAHVFDRGYVVRDELGVPIRIVGAVIDITERKRTEEALRESEERYRAVVEHSPDPIGVHVDGKLVLANRAIVELLGVRGPDELNGRSIFDFLHPDDRDISAGRTRRMLESGLPEPAIEMKFVLPNGRVLYGEVSAVPLSYGGRRAIQTVVRDITPRKLTEVALRQSEARFRSLIENASETVAVLDESGVIRYQSSSSRQVLGYTAEEMEGNSAFALLHPEDAERARAALAGLAAELGGRRTLELRVRHQDGSWRTVDVSGTNRLEDPAVRGLVMNVRDVTEQRRLEEQLRQAQKLEAVGRLAGGVAHDFNNIVTAIRGHAEFVLEATAPGSTAHEDGREILKNADRAAQLTRQLLAFSRQQVLRPRILDLGAVVRSAEGLLRRLIGEHIDFRVRIDERAGVVEADPNQLEQVLVNLAVNARDAMPGGGRLTISVAAVLLDDALTAGFGFPVRPGAYACITVADTGEGMDEETRSKLFEPFFTTKEQGKGTGLGLATVYGIVKQSGGYVRVESEPGSGTTFRVFLPRAEGDPEPGDAAPGDQSTGEPAARETILLVEDEEGVRKLARRVLERMGYRVLEAASPSEALLDVLPSAGAGIDLLLTDVVMPEMGGRELADRVRDLCPGIRTIFMSGYTEDQLLQRGEGPAAGRFLEKPFTPTDLARNVREVLAGE